MKTESILNRVYGAGFLFNVAFLTFAILVPLDALHRGLSVFVVGILAAIPGIMQLPTRILSGPMVDFLGERLVLGITFSLALCAGIAVVVLDRAPVTALIVGQLGIGAARGFFWTAAQSKVSRQPGNRARYLGLFTSFTKGGALVGIAAAGTLAGSLGMAGGFLLSSSLSLWALVIALTLPKGDFGVRAQGMGSAIKGVWPASLQPFVVVNGLVALLCAIPQALGQSFYPIVLIRLGLSQSMASALTALMSLGMIGAGIIGSRVLGRLGMRRMVAVSVVLLAFSIAGTALHNALGDTAVIFLGGLAAGWLNMAFLTAVSARSGESDRGTNLGVTQVYFVVAMMLTPVISGWLFSVLGRADTFLIEGAGAFVLGILVMGLWRWQEGTTRQSARQPA